MKLTIKALLATSIPLASTACSDTSVGRDECYGANTRCTAPHAQAIQLARTETYAEAAAQEIVPTWSFGFKFRAMTKAGDDGVWIFDWEGAAPVGVAHVSAEGEPVDSDTFAVAGDSVRDVVVDSDARGAFAVVTWDAEDGDTGAEILAFGSRIADLPTRIAVRNMPGDAQIKDVKRDEQGNYYLLLDHAGGVVRKVDPEGATVWQQAALPANCPWNGSALLGSDGTLSVACAASLPGVDRGVFVAHLDADGNIVSLGQSNFETLDFALAGARGDGLFFAATSDGGDIHFYDYQGPDTYEPGMIRRTGEGPLTLLDASSDSAGHVYTLSLSGSRTNPRPLVCEFRDGLPRCFRAEGSAQFAIGADPQSLLSTDDGALYLSFQDGVLARFDL